MADESFPTTTLTFTKYMSAGDTIIDYTYGPPRPDTYHGLYEDDPDYVRYKDEFGVAGLVPVYEWERRFKSGDLQVAVEPDVAPKFTDWIDPGDEILDYTYGSPPVVYEFIEVDDGFVRYYDKTDDEEHSNLAACWQIALEKGDMKYRISADDIPPNPFPEPP